MIRVDVKHLNGNEILAVPVVAEDDRILVQSETELKDEYIEKLKELGIQNVYVREKNSAGQSVRTKEEELENRKVSIRGKHIYKVDETKEHTKEIITDILDRHIYKHSSDLKKIGKAAEDIIDSVLEEPEVVTNITEIRNVSTDMYSHCINVCSLSTILALRLKMTDKQVRNIAMGAILHDIGLKYVQIPYENYGVDEMSPRELIEYKKHTIYGYSSIENEDWLSDAAKEIILLHHENINGTGFPFQHKNHKLKAEVRLVSVCDDFDSLISGICSRKMKIYQAIEYIKVHTGVVYDATIAQKLLETVAVYPIGINVLTNEGEIGVVVQQNKEVMDRPVIKMLRHADGTDYEKPVIKDLLKHLTLFIVDTL
jgi:HD-GYP domain-containing protein (c-di-GMP phosphodiesterase class II)